MDSVILLQETRGEKTDTSIVGTVRTLIGLVGIMSSSVVVVRGELLVPIPGDEITPRNDRLKPHNHRLKRDPTVSLYCKDDGNDIAPLGTYERLLLEGIKSTTVRYEVFISANMLDWGSNLKPGDAVYVGLPSQHTAPVQYAEAVIRYVGSLKGETGIHFGVEITERQFHGWGATNGFFQEEQIFLCKENCGLFVGLDRLSPDRQGSRVKVSSSSQGVKNESSTRKSSVLDQRQSDGSHQHGMVTHFRERASNAVQRQHSVTSVDPPRCVFSTGDRVVVYNKKNLRISGVVRWVGKVTGHGAVFMAVGIETDYPVKKEDFVDALPNMSHYFKVQSTRRGKVFIPEAFVAPEEVDAQQRAQKQRSSMHKEDRSGKHREGEALAKEFGIPALEIARQRQVLSYAEHIKEKRDLERLKCQEKQEVEQVQKAVTEHINVDEQRRRLEKIKQERLNMSQQDTHQNAYLSRRGPSLPHQHSQPPMHSTQTSSRLGPPHQFSLDAPHPSPARQVSHKYKTLPGMQMQRQATSAEEHFHDHIDIHGTQPANLHPVSSHQSAPPQPNPQQLDPPHFDDFSSGPQGTQVPVAYALQPQQQVQLGEFSIGSTVQISDPPRYGVIRWIGELPNIQGYVAGVELDEYMEGCTDGTWHERRYFTCAYGRGFFIPYYNLSPDRRSGKSENTLRAAPAENYVSPAKSSLPKEEGRIQIEKKSENEKALLEQCTKIETQLSQVHHEKQDLQERYKRLEEQLQQEKQQCMEDHTRLEQQLKQETAQLKQEVTQERQETARLRQEMARLRQEAAEVKQQLEGRLQELIADNQRLQQQVADSQAEAQQTRLIQPQSTLEAIEYWKVPRRDIQTTREIGRGTWGSIFEGKYKEQLVAIKQPHQLILTLETIDRLQREVQIMAQVRHPNLVRFIAAVFDDKVQRLEEPPMIILELLDMNLRTAYERDVLGASKIPIFRDVAYALHYLHEHQDPIIHRDISTPNVLLEALPQGTWKAKVSDFGSANLEKRSKTAGEGAIIYSAPETFPHTDPTTLPPPQTTKIDVFSYGILLCEVITKQLPEDSTIYRQMLQQVEKDWLFMYDLIVSCTKRDPNERPTMAQVLDKLNKLPRPRPRFRQHS